MPFTALLINGLLRVDLVKHFVEKEDARKRSREVPHERRKQVARMRRLGVGAMQLVEPTGLSGSTVNPVVHPP